MFFLTLLATIYQFQSVTVRTRNADGHYTKCTTYGLLSDYLYECGEGYTVGMTVYYAYEIISTVCPFATQAPCVLGCNMVIWKIVVQY